MKNGPSETLFSEDKALLHYGHLRGWLEDCDERFPDSHIDRRAAARIIHMFLKIECNLKDLNDISAARELKDLYTCPSCTEHIAQVFCRGIMGAENSEIDENSQSLIFNHLAPLSQQDANEIFEKISLL